MRLTAYSVSAIMVIMVIMVIGTMGAMAGVIDTVAPILAGESKILQRGSAAAQEHQNVDLVQCMNGLSMAFNLVKHNFRDVVNPTPLPEIVSGSLTLQDGRLFTKHGASAAFNAYLELSFVPPHQLTVDNSWSFCDGLLAHGSSEIFYECDTDTSRSIFSSKMKDTCVEVVFSIVDTAEYSEAMNFIKRDAMGSKIPVQDFPPRLDIWQRHTQSLFRQLHTSSQSMMVRLQPPIPKQRGLPELLKSRLLAILSRQTPRDHRHRQVFNLVCSEWRRPIRIIQPGSREPY